MLKHCIEFSFLELFIVFDSDYCVHFRILLKIIEILLNTVKNSCIVIENDTDIENSEKNALSKLLHYLTML